MPSRRDILRAVAASAATLVLRPAMAGQAFGGTAFGVVAPFVEDGSTAALGLWTRHSVPDRRLALPARVHAVALHPRQTSCVAVARRPGRFGVAVDLARFEESATFESTSGRHFFGHGLFTGDGSLFLTTENDYEAGNGIIGVRDPRRGFAHVAEWSSGGIGPHDIALSRDGASLLVANGGIDMSPDSGRAKLNEGGIVSTLTRIEIASGRQTGQLDLGPDNASLSIRHLAMLAGGSVAFGCQETVRDGVTRPLVGLADAHGGLRWVDAPPGGWAAMAGYVGEIATDDRGLTVAATAPLAGLCAVWDAATGTCLSTISLADCCGLGGTPDGFVVTSGRGEMVELGIGGPEPLVEARIGFDNHLAVV